MPDPVRVTVYDPGTGESHTVELPEDNYILLCGHYMEVAYRQEFPRTGTVQLTLKRIRRGDDDG